LKIRNRGRHVAEVDIAWPEVQLCIEVDGWAYHNGQDAFVGDRARDRTLMGLGWMIFRYTSDDLRDEPWSIGKTSDGCTSRARLPLESQ
jgi:very-short-patch-repair endonuclease